MIPDTQFSKIETDDSLMETTKHGDHTFPFEFYYEDVAKFDFNCIEWHWHTELEFVYIQSGTVHFQVGNSQFDLSEGCGILINSKILHRMSSAESAIIPNFLCHPSFIAPEKSLIYQKYIAPVIDSSEEYFIFSPDTNWQKEILSEMNKIINQYLNESINELIISSSIQKIWLNISENIIINPKINTQKTAEQARLQLMMQYIHTNYYKSLSLKEIAASADISKSSALNLFQKILYTSPVNYLIHYRLKEAALLLINTEKKIHTISLETGFNNVDYFCKTFKKIYGITPGEYRKSKLF